MTVHPRLLDHPFYQAWTMGEISRDTLAQYHRAYGEFIEQIPSYWGTVVRALHPQSTVPPRVVEEERHHVLLWERWGNDLGAPREVVHMKKTLSAFEVMTPSQLLGALQAFEVQQPEVARTKKEGLMKHYGMKEDRLAYFDEHLLEEKHIAYGAWLADRFADRQEFEEGFVKGADLIYSSLDLFLSQ